MKRIITVLLLCCLLLTLCACAPANSKANKASSNNQTASQSQSHGSSYYKWVGRFNLEKIELNGSTLYAKDFESSTGWNPNQYVLLNQDYTGEMAITSIPGPARLYNIQYSYDIAHESGSIFIKETSETFRFQIENNYLVIDFSGVIWTFKKQ